MRRCKAGRLEAHREKEFLKRGPDRLIVIDDQHEGAVRIAIVLQ